MFENLINKLKAKKQQLQNPVFYKGHIDNHNPTFEILLSQENKFFKMEISDYISIVDYEERMKKIDNFGLESMISASVLWNSKRQKVNKGTYFVIKINNRLYNILISDGNLIIDERTNIEQIIEERIIRLENNNYWCTFFKHDIAGNTFYTRYYNTCDFSLGTLDLTKEETIEILGSVIDNLRNIDGIDDIIDLSIFEQNSKKELKKL